MAQQVTLSLSYAVKTDDNDVQSGAATLVDDTSVTARIGGVRAVAPAANVQLPFDGAAESRLLVIRADGAFNVRVGGAAVDPIAVAPVAAGQEALFVASAQGASVYVENPGVSASINVKWLLAGV